MENLDLDQVVDVDFDLDHSAPKGYMRFGQPFKTSSWRWVQASVLICMVWLACGELYASESDMFVVQLRAKHTELVDQLLHNRFGRALYLESAESPNDLTSEIYAVVEYTFATVNAALNNPAHWCDVLILHINVKSCHASSSEAGTVLAIHLGRKSYQPLVDAFRLEFDYRTAITTQDYFALELYAKDGPLSTPIRQADKPGKSIGRMEKTHSSWLFSRTSAC